MTIPILDAAKFMPYAGEPFQLIREGTIVNAVLAKIAEYPASTMPGGARTAFSLFFCVQQQECSDVESGTYVLEHRSLDAIGPLHIERVLSPQPDVIRLEIAFN